MLQHGLDQDPSATKSGPPLWLLAEFTYRCPLHCAFCFNPVDFVTQKAELDTDGWIKTLRQVCEMNDLLSNTRTFDLKNKVAALIKEYNLPMMLNCVIHRMNINHVDKIIEMNLEPGAETIELANTHYYLLLVGRG